MALHGEQLGGDRVLVGGQLLGHRRRRSPPAQGRPTARRALGPSRAPGRSGCRGCRSRSPCGWVTCSPRGTCRWPGRACRPGSARACWRWSRRVLEGSAASAKNSPRLSHRRWFSFTSCCTCFGAEPPGAGLEQAAPLMSGTIDSILALVPRLQDREQVGEVVAQHVAGQPMVSSPRRMRSSENAMASTGALISIWRPLVSWSGGTSAPWR